MLVDPAVAKERYEVYARKQEEYVARLFKNNNIDLLKLSTDSSFISPLAEFLRERVERRALL
jgi:hypothetical protein